MKTNDMIALVPAQWKAPWRMPVGNILIPMGNRIRSKFKDRLKKTARDLKDIIKKHWLHD